MSGCRNSFVGDATQWASKGVLISYLVDASVHTMSLYHPIRDAKPTVWNAGRSSCDMFEQCTPSGSHVAHVLEQC